MKNAQELEGQEINSISLFPKGDTVSRTKTGWWAVCADASGRDLLMSRCRCFMVDETVHGFNGNLTAERQNTGTPPNLSTIRSLKPRACQVAKMMAFSARFEKRACLSFPERLSALSSQDIHTMELMHTSHKKHWGLAHTAQHTMTRANAADTQESVLMQLPHWDKTPSPKHRPHHRPKRTQALPWLTYLAGSWPPHVMLDIQEGVLASDARLRLQDQPTFLAGVEANLQSNLPPNWASLMVLKCLYFDILPASLRRALAQQGLEWMLQSSVQFSPDGQHIRNPHASSSPWVRYEPPAMPAPKAAILASPPLPLAQKQPLAQTPPVCTCNLSPDTLLAPRRRGRKMASCIGTVYRPQAEDVFAVFVQAVMAAAFFLLVLDLIGRDEGVSEGAYWGYRALCLT